jgi:hypothetical protein
MIWRMSHRCDPAARVLADRHYNRQSIGAPNFVPPGRCLVFVAGAPVKAFWVSSWPIAEYTHHAWAGAWMCTAFRNEGAGLSSDLIQQAVAATRAIWGTPPPLGMVSFVDRTKVKAGRPGHCYHKAGFKTVGETKVNRLVALQLLPDAMPLPEYPFGASIRLFGAA